MRISVNVAADTAGAAYRPYNRKTSRIGETVTAAGAPDDLSVVNLPAADRERIIKAVTDKAGYGFAARMLYGAINKRFGIRHYWQLQPHQVNDALAVIAAAYVPDRRAPEIQAAASLHQEAAPAPQERRPPVMPAPAASARAGLNAGDLLSLTRELRTAESVAASNGGIAKDIREMIRKLGFIADSLEYFASEREGFAAALKRLERQI